MGIMFAFVLVICMWLYGDLGLIAKFSLSLLYLASWTLLFLSPAYLNVAQIVLSILLGGMTFGVGWLTQRYYERQV